MIEPGANAGRATALDDRLGRAAIERGDGLGAIPGEGLGFAAGPLFDPAEDFEHFAQPRLGTRTKAAVALREGGQWQADGPRQLIAADEQPGGNLASVDEALRTDEASGKRAPVVGRLCLVGEEGDVRNSVLYSDVR